LIFGISNDLLGLDKLAHERFAGQPEQELSQAAYFGTMTTDDFPASSVNM